MSSEKKKEKSPRGRSTSGPVRSVSAVRLALETRPTRSGHSHRKVPLRLKKRRRVERAKLRAREAGYPYRKVARERPNFGGLAAASPPRAVRVEHIDMSRQVDEVIYEPSYEDDGDLALDFMAGYL